MSFLAKLFLTVGVGALVYLLLIRLKKKRQFSHEADVGRELYTHKDHPSGNSIPLKTVQPFKKVSDYLFSPWDPTNNAEKIEFLDAENMPRTDYILPGGSRLVTHGFVNHVRTGRPAFPTHGAHSGKILAPELPISATTTKKNLNYNTSIWHGQH